MTKKQEIAKTFFQLFVKNEVPDNMVFNYLNDIDGEPTLIFQVWITNNMKQSISKWCTGIGIIESFERCYNASLENGAIK